MFDLSHLRCFVAVADELHFARAAERLSMTQPPLSRQIQILERVLDVRLLERTSRSVKLTPAGQTFLSEARQILQLAESAAHLAKRVAAGKAGSIKIGFTATSAFSFLPELVAACRDIMSGAELALKEMVSGDQLRRLHSGEIDIGIIRPPVPSSGLSILRVSSESLLAAVPADHPLVCSAVLKLEELAAQPFIMYAPYEGRYFHDLVAETFARAGILPNYVHHLAQIHSILALVHAGVGVSLVPTAAANLQFRNVVLRPIRPLPPRPAELFMVWRTDNPNALVPIIADLSRKLVEKKLPKPIDVPQRRGVVETTVASPS